MSNEISSPRKILILGASGMLGQSLVSALATIPDTTLFTPSSHDCDITDSDVLSDTVAQLAPNIIINCAAYTAVDNAETHIQKANALNHLAPQHIACAANNVNALLVHISTDYVFDGLSDAPYHEDAHTNPINAYGRTKLLGEQAIVQTARQYIIIRTQWLYSTVGHNFFLTMLRLFKTHGNVNVVADQFGSPTYAHDLACAIRDIVVGFRPELSGIYHFANSGRCSWCDFAQAIASLAHTQCTVSPIPTSDYPTPAQRPHYSVLCTDKIASTFNLSIPSWRDALARCFNALPQI